MSILNSVLNGVERHSELNQQQHLNLVQTAMQMFGNHSGISDLMNNTESQALSDIVQSWLSTGANQPIAAQQVQQLISEDRVNQLAARVGIPPAAASAALARILPVVVDKLMPQGRLPQVA